MRDGVEVVWKRAFMA